MLCLPEARVRGTGHRTSVGVGTLRSMMMDVTEVKALIFDVFGTVVD
jgi:hypothetical protein